MNELPAQPAASLRWLAPVLAASVLVMLVSWLAWQPGSPPVPWPETNRTNLVHLAGGWYEPGRTNPYTGWLVDYYQNGARLSRSMVSNGLLNGLSQGWYTNGQLQIQETYRDNYSEGERKKWSPEGRLLTAATVVHGRFQGLFRRWYPNGKLAEEIPMTNGQPDGLGRSYYENGTLKAEVQMQAGKIVSRKDFPDGTLARPSPAGTGRTVSNSPS